MSSAKQRVLLAITLGEHGGATQFVARFAQHLHIQNVDVTVISGDGDWLEQSCNEQHIPYARLQHLGRAIYPVRDLRAFLECVRLFRSLKPDVVHLNSSKMGVIGSLAARLAHVPRVVYRIGGWSFLEPTWHARLDLWMERISARWKDVIVCVHPGDAQVARSARIRPKSEPRVIPNGIDLDAFDALRVSREEARASFGYAPDDFVFLTIAHAYPAKALPAYLSVCRTVADQDSHARFLLIGDGPERAKIMAERSRLELGTVVQIVSGDGHDARWLSVADAFVLPSIKEGMPTALLEAMAAKLPCIATDVGATRWMLEPDAGWIVPPRDAEALSSAMFEVMQNTVERQARSQSARRVATERFPLDRTLQEHKRSLSS